MAKPPKPDAFTFSPDDPLVVEHGVVAAWIEEALGTLGEQHYYQDVDLKSLPAGRKLLEADAEQARRHVIAAVAQTRHWDEQADKVRARAATEMERINAHTLPGWSQVWGKRRQAEAVVRALMRRTLPLQKADLLAILEWCNGTPNLNTYFAPIGHICRALKRYAAESAIDPDLRAAMQRFASQLRAAHDKPATRLGTEVEQLCGEALAAPARVRAAAIQPPPQPAVAGNEHVFFELKQFLEMLPDDATAQSTTIEPDRFALGDASPLRPEHELLSVVFEEVIGTRNYYQPDLRALRAGREVQALPPVRLGKVLVAAAERHVNAILNPSANYQEHGVWQSRYAAAGCAAALLAAKYELDRNELFDLLLYLSVRPTHERSDAELLARLLGRAEQEAATVPLTEGERYVLWLFRAALIAGPPFGLPSDEVSRLTALINDGARFYLAPGDAWSDQVNDDISRQPAAVQQQWAALLRHAATATSARPTDKWLQTGGKVVDAIGGDQVRETLARWLPAVALGRSIRKLGAYSGDVRGAGDVMNDENATCLRGLLWLVQRLPRQEELARAITAAAISAYKKVPGVGPRAVKVGNAAVYALAQMGTGDAVGQLALLKVRIKFGTAQKEIEKAFNKAAEALGLPRDQIEEMGVPSYGLEEVGRRQETIGACRALLVVSGSDAELKWFDAKDKPLKAVPAKVKSDHKEDLKELQQSLKDIQAMLPAQRDRIDAMFLAGQSWPIDTWRERYLHHPLVGTIAQRLLWCVDGAPALFLSGAPTDVQGAALAHGKTAEITLWHPVGRPTDEIVAWRRRLEELRITQPFKQAHREVYLLTDAERNTRTYSNRFAAHILRQHQFHALCAARGWKNKLRLMVDDTFPPASRELPHWGLRAEFWIEGVGTDYGTDTNQSGAYLRLSTDQVRFYRTEAARNLAQAGGGAYVTRAGGPGRDNINEPLPLEEVPPLVFSEIMRDVDLFVGVASVGNDPTWHDGGPQGRYVDYWHSYSFGELSGSATTRKQVLERLLPRLKIAARCALADRFLVVQGQRRTYKIHLGSGNVLMEPNDQYLCIVPDSRTRTQPDDLFLPFEGDNMLSIILSKALMLADDARIKDPTITRQIDSR